MTPQNPFCVRNKRILVTGASRGIGAAITRDLAEAGAFVIANYCRNDKAAEQLKEACEGLEGEVVLCRADLTRSGGQQKVAEAVGNDGLDGLVHCAATGVHGKLDKLTTRHFDWTFSLNLRAFFELVQSVKGQLTSGASIVAMSSEGGQLAVQDYTLVGASKGGLESLCRHLAVELASDEIRVNCLSPGSVQTDSWDALPDAEARLDKAQGHNPFGRLTCVDEIAHSARFLLSPAARGINGQVIVVDGGSRIRSV